MTKVILKNIKIYECNFLIPWQSFFDSFFFTIEVTCCQFKFDISGSTFNCDIPAVHFDCALHTYVILSGSPFVFDTPWKYMSPFNFGISWRFC